MSLLLAAGGAAPQPSVWMTPMYVWGPLLTLILMVSMSILI
jgi:hypothetical protein